MDTEKGSAQKVNFGEFPAATAGDRTSDLVITCTALNHRASIGVDTTEIRLMRSLVTSTFLYACESWTLTAELQRRIQAMDISCYRKILHISYKDHVTNEEVCAKIPQWGAEDAEIKVPSVENTELKGSPFE